MRDSSVSQPTGEPGRSFRLELRAEPGVDPVAALRGLLKRALRDHGLRATQVSYGDLIIQLDPEAGR